MQMNYKIIGKIVAKGLKEKDSIMIFRHIPGISAEAVFSECGKFRYKLIIENTVSDGDKTVCAVMQNPSVANSDIADKSAQFLEKLIFKKDYIEFNDVNKIIIINQFAYVQTNDFDGSESHIGTENDTHIRQAVNTSDIVLIAWGTSNRHDGRKRVINSIINEFSSKVLLQTKAHPSRGTYVDFIKPYSI